MFWLSKNVSRLQAQKVSDAVGTAEPILQSSGLLTPFSDKELKAITKFPIIPTQKGLIEKGWPVHEKNESNEYKSPSVNRVLSATMPEASRQALLRWKMGKIAELGEEGFQKLQKDIFERGSNLHSTLETWLSGSDPSDDMIGRSGTLWKSIQGALNDVERPAKIVERKLYHPYLHYNGVVDCITAIRGQPHIIEWKTSDNPKASVAATYDAPIQLCAYLGALQASNEWTEGKLQNGAIFVAYTDGKPAHVHLLSASDMRRYWQLWLQRLQEYWIRYRDGTLPEPI
ncbi:AGAP010576-PA-like protein [Anopheles sinensis]|uniref:Mitochondrial genome maintenance exonuclease 1 n=1 Tax=Anopheles sinensis TaxID=74873 RepID=A0A084WI57_ANOSI|nr:AGAP010576-PA-like protein [Anopheles sinensis]